MAHWHDFNPWSDHLVYVPDLEELSACLDPHNPTGQLARWDREQPGRKLDAYLLRSPSGNHHCGIRWGQDGCEYYSPDINPYIAELLLAKYERTGA